VITDFDSTTLFAAIPNLKSLHLRGLTLIDGLRGIHDLSTLELHGLFISAGELRQTFPACSGLQIVTLWGNDILWDAHSPPAKTTTLNILETLSIMVIRGEDAKGLLSLIDAISPRYNSLAISPEADDDVTWTPFSEFLSTCSFLRSQASKAETLEIKLVFVRSDAFVASLSCSKKNQSDELVDLEQTKSSTPSCAAILAEVGTALLFPLLTELVISLDGHLGNIALCDASAHTWRELFLNLPTLLFSLWMCI
jgi:hypothetical protein